MRGELKMTRFITAFALAATTLVTAFGSPALAEMMAFKATLDAKSEVPPTDSAATGTADVQVDSEAKKVTWTVTHNGLTGPATAAHFHGPADPGANAGPAIDISGNIESGSADLTDAQLADFQAGKMYLNIHTEKFPDGEIRGQVMK
jgi:CHRD domain